MYAGNSVLSLFIEIVPPSSKNLYIFFPHAGGMPQSAYMLKNFIPSTDGCYAVNYASKELIGLSYIELCTKIINYLIRYMQYQITFIGSSYGAYMSYSIAQRLDFFHNKKVAKLIMTSVRDLESVKKKICHHPLEYHTFIENYADIPLEIQKLSLDLVKRDIDILKGIHILPFKIRSPIIIWNGASDIFCHCLMTQKFWQQQGKNIFEYHTYMGGHIPRQKDWQLVFQCL